MKYKNENLENLESLNWEKVDGLLPVIIQDCETLQVLMLGYMNVQALNETIKTNKVTFYSRTKKRLWVKGETSGNYLSLVNIIPDCDNDTLLIMAKPNHMVCHLEKVSCFNNNEAFALSILTKLEDIISKRYEKPSENSYVSRLKNEGRQRIAQKVGEEAIEMALASVTDTKTAIINETADLLFHMLVLLRECDINLNDIMLELGKRSK